ncbi:MAG: hypothetical protein DRI73_05270 [Bacteroidetes bacterium]|nr:MAG: hypothetical protein DRI73_05270 [Bacteroidota bacterium]
MRYIWIIIIILIGVSCSETSLLNKNRALAKVGSKVLMKREVPDLYKEGISEEDSIALANKFIENWIRKELLYKKAQENLSRSQQNEINYRMEESKASLSIYYYEQGLIRQKMNAAISEKEINDYYEAYPNALKLKDNIVKALFIQIPASSPNIKDVKKWYKSDDDNDLNELESYCYQYAKKFDDFNEEWVSFNFLLKHFPKVITSNPERFLRYNKGIEAKDSSYYYFASIREYKLKSSVSPIEYVENQIKSIIFNQRKIKFINELENSLYNEAKTNNEFEIY